MANIKISDLPAATVIDNSDLLVLVDVSASDTKKATVSQVLNLATIIGAVSYQGTWNATTNSPSIVSSTGTKGHYYVVSVAGSTSIDGISSWAVGDWIIYNGSAWQKVDNTDAVSSVNGQTGAVSLGAADVGAPATTGTGASGTWGIDITGSAAGLSSTLAVGSGGTGATTLAANNVLLGNGTSALQTVAPGTSGNVLTSNGTTWVSQAAAGGGGGSTVDVTIATTGLTVGDVCYVSSNNTTSAANATAISTAGALGIVQTVGNSSTGKVRTQGVITANFVSSLTLVAGDTAYLSKTSGKLTNNVSSYTSGNVYVPVGVVTNVTTAGGGNGAAEVAVNLDLSIVV